MKFCFFGHIYPAMIGKTQGGGELQIYLLAKSLALHGHEVTIIDPYSDHDYISPEGIRLVTVPEWKKGTKALRFFMYRLPALKKIFRAQQADYFYVRMRSFAHLIPYFIAKKQGKKFIQGVASDIDVLSAGQKFKYEYRSHFNLFRFLTEHLPCDLAFNYLIKKSDYVALQHTGQHFKSSKGNGKQVIFSNIIDITKLPPVNEAKHDYFIYVGSLTMLKGADNLLKLINTLSPNVQIMIVGMPKDEEPKRIYEALGKKPNVLLKGHQAHHETLNLISKAKALINTSYFEGFPNIYLEAWGTGVPVISLNVNPGDIIEKNNLGVCCNGDLHKMKMAIEQFDQKGFNSASLTSYVKNNHDFEGAAERFLKVIEA